jgi:lysophospholipase L1-like esterase
MRELNQRFALVALLCSIPLFLASCGGGGGTSTATPGPSTPTPTPTPISIVGVSNLTPANTVQWRNARSAALANLARARVAAIGDSTTAGLGSAGALWTNSTTQAYPVQLAVYLSSRGLVAHSSSFFGDLGAVTEFPGTDPRISLGAGWLIDDNQPTLGGFPVVNATTSSPLAFRPQTVADRVEIYDVPLANGATMDVWVSGTTITSIAPPASPAIIPRRTTISFPRNTDPEIAINARVNGGAIAGFQLIGMDAYDSTRADVAIWNMGASGTKTDFWLTSGHVGAPLDTLVSLRPDVTLVNLGINDMVMRTDPAVFKANMRAILLRADGAGDVVVIVPNRVDPLSVPIDLQKAYETALFELSTELAIPIVSIPSIIGEFEQARAVGYYFDDVHLSAAGYAKVAATLGELLLAN